MPRPHLPVQHFQTSARAVSLFRWLFCNRYLAFILALSGYACLAAYLGVIHGGLKYLSCQYLELIILFYLFYYLNAIVRPSRWQPLLAAAPIFLAYVGQDIYYLLLGKIFRVIELTEVAELFKIMSFKYLLLVILASAITLFGFISSLNFRRKKVIAIGVLPLLGLILCTELQPERFLSSFKYIGREIVNWSDAIPVQQNGRFAMLFFHEAQRKIALRKTDAFHNRPAYDQDARNHADWLREKGNGRNVHLVMMESFVDPTLFREAHYTSDPVHPRFRKLFGDKLGFSVSPVFGGKTSQAEFEALCGVPAFQELAGVEFNAFSGAPAYCLPGILKLAGYRTIATNSYEPTFFNAVSAYEGIGFGEMYFPREFSPNSETYLTAGDTTGEIYMFDSVLFEQNLQFIARYLKDTNRKPVFNYVLTMYGHLPHILNKKKRPTILDLVSRFRDPQLARVANQFFYRSQAVAEYIEQLKSIDPDSLIILVSDHLPPLQGLTTYKNLKYMDNRKGSTYLNRIMILENGTVTHYATIHHYDIPKLVMNYLTDGEFCRGTTCGFTENQLLSDRQDMHDAYRRLMAHAIK